MAHYAKVSNGFVVDIIVADEGYIQGLPKSPDHQWIQASYNTRGGVHYEVNSNTPSQDQSKALRKNYPGVGYMYDNERDAFYLPSPFPSWVLNEDSCLWEPPVPMPNDNNLYTWNESTLSWDVVSE